MDESCQKKMDRIKRDSIRYRTVFTHTVHTVHKKWIVPNVTVFSIVRYLFTRFRKAFAIAYRNTRAYRAYLLHISEYWSYNRL